MTVTWRLVIAGVTILAWAFLAGAVGGTGGWIMAAVSPLIGIPFGIWAAMGVLDGQR